MTNIKKTLSLALVLILALSVFIAPAVSAGEIAPAEEAPVKESSQSTTAKTASSKKSGINTVYFQPGVSSGSGAVWFGWTWFDGKDGHWVKGGVNAKTVEFKKLCDYVIFVKMPKGSKKASWDKALSHSPDFKVKGISFTVTKWSGKNEDLGVKIFTGKWSVKAPKGYFKPENTIKVSVKSQEVKASALKKAKKTFKLVTFRDARGAVRFAKVKKGTTSSVYKKISVNKKTGAITFKKGKYASQLCKIVLSIKAKGADGYKAKKILKTVTVNIKGKKKAAAANTSSSSNSSSSHTHTSSSSTMCYNCAGTGRISCALCGGSGGKMESYTSYPTYTPPGTIAIPQTSYRWVTCMGCGGSGKMMCGTCGGTGRRR